MTQTITRLIWKPLNGWYKTMYGRPSMFDQYVTCPHKYKYAPPFTSAEQELWTYAHNMLQWYKTGRVSYEESLAIAEENEFTKKQKKLLRERLDLVVEDEPTLRDELEGVLEIEMWKFLFIIPYHIDNEIQSWLSDYKTSKAEWKEDIEYKYQRICYSLWYYFSKYERDPNLPMPFKFIVLTKHARWARKQVVQYDNNGDEFLAWKEFDKLISLLKKICVSEVDNNYQAQPNIFCRWCPLYNNCPHFNSLPLY